MSAWKKSMNFDVLHEGAGWLGGLGLRRWC